MPNRGVLLLKLKYSVSYVTNVRYSHSYLHHRHHLQHRLKEKQY